MIRAITTMFFRDWFAVSPGGLCEIRPLNKRTCNAPRPSFHRTAVEAVGYAMRACAAGADVYLGAQPRAVRAGGADAVQAHRWLVADVDFGSIGHAAPSRHETEADALRAVTLSGLRPRWLVATGGGLQVWWRLAREARSREAWSDAERRIVHAVGGDMAATDPARILRVPGTYNFKTGEPRPVRVLAFDPDALVDIGAALALPEVPLPPLATVHVLPTRTWSTSGTRPFDRANDVPIASVVQWLGHRVHREGTRFYAACPVCDRPDGDTGALCVGGKRNVATCFGDCRRTYTAVDLVVGANGVSPRDAVQLLARQFGFEGFAPPSARGERHG